MNRRLTITAAAAVLLASISEFAITSGGGWLVLGAGAVLSVMAAGELTRLAPLPAACGATALAALALAPTITSSSGWVKGAGLLGVAVCAVSVRKVRPLPAVASAVTYLAALALYLNAVLAGRSSFARLVPTASSVRQLVTLARQGFALTQYAPPVPDIRGLQLLLAGGIGLAAVATDVIAVRWRRPSLAGIPLAVLFLAPSVTTARTGGLAGTTEFLLAALGYLTLLSADGKERLNGWGRVITVWHRADSQDRPGEVEISKLTATGRRVGLAAATVAVIVPLVLPAMHLLRHVQHGNGGGVTLVGLPDPVVQMHGMLARPAVLPVLSYMTTSADPAAQYLQVYVLNYDQASNSWRLVAPGRDVAVGSRALPVPGEILAGTPEVSATSLITLGKIGGYTWPVHFLPVPYWPARLEIPGSWREDLQTQMIYSGQTPLAGLRYKVTSLEPQPSARLLAASQQLPAKLKASYLAFNSPVSTQLRLIAGQITRGKQSAYDRAVALERWFLAPGRFTYNLQPNLPGTPAGLLKFLTTSRSGYCQQFAFAMAVLARLSGIPSRIAVGYTAGERRPDGTWVVTTADAHAWPELYFQGAGWLRFEPTPGGTAGQGTAVAPSYAPPATTGPSSRPGSQPSAGPSGAPAGGITGPATQNPHRKQPGDGGGLSGPTGGLRRYWMLALICAAVLGALGALPAAIRAWTRRRRWRSAARRPGLTATAEAAWDELSDTLLDFGLTYRPCDSPRAIARTIRERTPGAAQAHLALDRVTSTVERAFYGPDQVARPDQAAGPTAGPPLRTDVAAVRRALGDGTSRSKRLRARLLPASTLRPAWSVIRQLTGLSGDWAATASSADPEVAAP